MIRVAILVAGALGILVIAVVAIGYALPVAHVASRDATRSDTRLTPKALNDAAISQTFSGGFVL